MADKPNNSKEPQKYKPGDGIRSMQSTSVFRAINFELYAKPVSSWLKTKIENPKFSYLIFIKFRIL